MTIDIEKNKNEISVTVDSIIAEIATLAIENQTQYETAGAWLVKNKETQKIVENKFDPIKKELYEPYKNVLDVTKFFMDKLKKSEKIVKQQMADYYSTKQKKLEEERKIRESVERKKLEEEAREKAEEEKLEKAIAADDESILDEEVEISPVIVPEIKIEKQKKPDGISFVDNWTFWVLDEKAIPDEYKTVDMKAIARAVKLGKEKTNIPGIRVYNDKQTRVRV